MSSQSNRDCAAAGLGHSQGPANTGELEVLSGMKLGAGRIERTGRGWGVLVMEKNEVPMVGIGGRPRPALENQVCGSGQKNRSRG